MQTPKRQTWAVPSAAAVFALLALLALSGIGASDYPSWWVARGVVNTNAVPYDYVAANLGQLKLFATNACAEMEARLPGGAGPTVWAMVAAFSPSNNYCAINLGQLKNVAAPFYDRLIAAGYTNAYPWTGAGRTNDYAMANVGQIKYVFSFDPGLDTDADGLPNWWEIKWFGGITNQTGTGDYDRDGLTNADEFRCRTNPTSGDTTNPVVTILTPMNGSVRRWLP